MLAASLKMVEQGRDFMAKTIDSAKSLAGDINQFVNKEVAKVPSQFQGELKGAIDELRNVANRVNRDQTSYETKLQKARVELGKLEAATKQK